MVTPIIATIKNIIDKDKIDNASRIYPIERKTGREDTDTSRDEDTYNGGTDPSTISSNPIGSDMISRSMDDSEETC
jgi:hypothetical protein